MYIINLLIPTLIGLSSTIKTFGVGRNGFTSSSADIRTMGAGLKVADIGNIGCKDSEDVVVNDDIKIPAP
jgi:hypothetical protein